MSWIHYLTIGRFEFLEEEREPNLVQRVLDHFTPGGLTRLGRDARVLAPFSLSEIAKIEKEVQLRFGLNLNLGEHLTEEGLLRIQYLGGGAFGSYAEHVAPVAYDLFGAIASDRGHAYSPAEIEKMSLSLLLRDSELERISGIEDGAERVKSIVAAMQRAVDDPELIHLAFALMAMRGASDSAILELISTLRHSSLDVKEFAALALGGFGERAKQAIPALVDVIGNSKSLVAYFAVESLGTIGKAAEPALLNALQHHDSSVRSHAIDALGKLGDLSESGRAMLREIGKHNDEIAIAALARATLRKLGK